MRAVQGSIETQSGPSSGVAWPLVLVAGACAAPAAMPHHRREVDSGAVYAVTAKFSGRRGLARRPSG